MKKQTKSILLAGIFGGFTFALIMSAFDYYDGESFNYLRFIINFLFFGIAMSSIAWSSLKKKQNKIK